MQNVDEHIDELFRKASEEYMLRDGESKWQDIALRLDPPARPAYSATGKRDMLKRTMLTTILLLSFLSLQRFYNANPHINLAKGKYSVTNNNAYISNSFTLKTGSEIVSETGTQKTGSATIKNVFHTAPAAIHLYDHPKRNKLLNSKKLYPVLPNLFTSSGTIPADASARLPQNTSIDSANTNIVSEDKNTSLSRFYFGISAAAGVNTIKHQSIWKPGFNAGIFAGYSFNTSLSFETALLFSKKNYCSDGKYFNTQKITGSMPSGMKVLDMKGSTTYFEIPIALKYNITTNKNNSFYITAGTSSYLLLHEKNNYTTAYNNNTGYMRGDYHTSKGYLFGSVNIAAGYSRTLAKKNTLRIEPYLQIPTKGVGVGDLPVSGSGIRVLFTLPALH